MKVALSFHAEVSLVMHCWLQVGANWDDANYIVCVRTLYTVYDNHYSTREF